MAELNPVQRLAILAHKARSSKQEAETLALNLFTNEGTKMLAKEVALVNTLLLAALDALQEIRQGPITLSGDAAADILEKRLLEAWPA